jgi:hypothetical protein
MTGEPRERGRIPEHPMSSFLPSSPMQRAIIGAAAFLFIALGVGVPLFLMGGDSEPEAGLVIVDGERLEAPFKVTVDGAEVSVNGILAASLAPLYTADIEVAQAAGNDVYDIVDQARAAPTRPPAAETRARRLPLPSWPRTRPRAPRRSSMSRDASRSPTPQATSRLCNWTARTPLSVPSRTAARHWPARPPRNGAPSSPKAAASSPPPPGSLSSYPPPAWASSSRRSTRHSPSTARLAMQRWRTSSMLRL